MGGLEGVVLKQHHLLHANTFASLRNSVDLLGVSSKQPRDDGKLKQGKLKHP